MIENNLENRLKFLGQHFFQNVIFDNKVTGKLVGITNKLLLDLEVIEGYDNNTPIIKEWCSSDTAVELKPLLSITDEDAMKVANIFRWTRYSDEGKVTQVKTFIEQHLDYHSTNISANEYFEMIDFLRSKGYALPYMEVSIKTLVEWSWIILIEK